MAAAKPEVHVSQLLNRIAKKFILFSGSGNSPTLSKGSMSQRKWHTWIINVVFLFLNCMHGKLVDEMPPSWISYFRFQDIALQRAPLSSPTQKHADSRLNLFAILYRSWDTGTSGMAPPFFISDFRFRDGAFSILPLSSLIPKTSR
jgi:hypothetical protein